MSMTQYDPAIHHRRSIRYPGYDYTAPGLYFITICVQGRELLLGDVSEGEMVLNEWGQIVKEEWRRLAERFPFVALDVHQVMPNHFHGMIGIMEWPSARRGVGTSGVGTSGVVTSGVVTSGVVTSGVVASGVVTTPLRLKSASLGQAIAHFKYQSTKRINALRETPGAKFWQRNYYDKIVRNERALVAIRRYIVENPANWRLDPDNANNIPRLASPQTTEEYLEDVQRHVTRSTGQVRSSL